MRSTGVLALALAAGYILLSCFGPSSHGGPAVVQVMVENQRTIKCFGDAEKLPPSSAHSDKLESCITQANALHDRMRLLAGH